MTLSYSPMGRGMLTGQIKSFEDIPDNDFRKILPRFQPENFEINMKLVKELEKIAKKKNCTSTQLAPGWVRSLSKREGMHEIIPIPGATTVDRVIENSIRGRANDGGDEGD
jgi:pyridoxine 4-dehydrogenase